MSFKWNDNSCKREGIVWGSEETCYLSPSALPVSAVLTYCFFFSLKWISHFSLAAPLASVGLCFVVYFVFICRNNACCFSYSVFVHCDPKSNTSISYYLRQKIPIFWINFSVETNLRPAYEQSHSMSVCCTVRRHEHSASVLNQPHSTQPQLAKH